jgi:hypothetical protein
MVYTIPKIGDFGHGLWHWFYHSSVNHPRIMAISAKLGNYDLSLGFPRFFGPSVLAQPLHLPPDSRKRWKTARFNEIYWGYTQ